ncbi:alpha/beta hydrolase [Methylovirgula sp. 4M-Z18]|uniref:alpha/beta fold hydrolase n=2 Tax=Methylovirgula sp. 4M-Z18 TaxID=2293567 RepID=UPI000E2F9ACE|nr:alpha/beta hydrolase [Methylovirgula sp. 4M-Z18]RFB80446.1 alpha/beta hydrolase [Methylovirgula sp. 4M-Z18]
MAKAILRNRVSAFVLPRVCVALASIAIAASPALKAMAAEIDAVKNIVLVHGANTDGSGWRGVYDILKKDGYRVSVVQEPLTGLSDDVAATKRVIDQQDGPIILVGHSYGGTIITVAGADPKVRALVYVAALQPDVGETTNQLAASIPGDIPASDIKPTKDGFLFVDPSKFAADVATDLPPAQAAYMANAQMPVAAAAFDAPVSVAAWHDKPSYGIVATADRALNPMLARWMYKRSGAKITEIKGSHLVYISQPDLVAGVIETAAHAVAENTTKTQ